MLDSVCTQVSSCVELGGCLSLTLHKMLLDDFAELLHNTLWKVLALHSLFKPFSRTCSWGELGRARPWYAWAGHLRSVHFTDTVDFWFLGSGWNWWQWTRWRFDRRKSVRWVRSALLKKWKVVVNFRGFVEKEVDVVVALLLVIRQVLELHDEDKRPLVRH